MIHHHEAPKTTSQAVSGRPKKTGRPRRPDQESGGNRSDQKLDGHRRRQVCISAVLEHTFGEPAKCNPDLWGRRAYLMLVGLVYERLATNEDEISTDELVTLAKVLAENRRAEARSREHRRTEEATQDNAPGTGELPDNVADVVRQVYGANFQTPDAEPVAERKEGADNAGHGCNATEEAEAGRQA